MIDRFSFTTAIWISCFFVTLLWGIKLGEVILGWQLWDLGVYPGSQDGLLGILSAPLIHGSWQHVASNTPGILLLGGIMIYGYPKSCWWALILIWLLSGLGVWLFGRENYHIGASGLTHGMFFYLLIGGILRRDKRSTALLMIAFFMYGSMLMTIFPREPGISYEYHLFGGIAGALCAALFARWDPKFVEADDGFNDEQEADEPHLSGRYVVIDDDLKEVKAQTDQEVKNNPDQLP